MSKAITLFEYCRENMLQINNYNQEEFIKCASYALRSIDVSKDRVVAVFSDGKGYLDLISHNGLVDMCNWSGGK